MIKGATVHHMFPIYAKVPTGPHVYSNNLKALSPHLQKLTSLGVRVIWMVSQPTSDLAYFLKHAENLREIFVHLDKLVHFNELTRNILSTVRLKLDYMMNAL